MVLELGWAKGCQGLGSKRNANGELQVRADAERKSAKEPQTLLERVRRPDV